MVEDVPDAQVVGPERGDLLLVSWGGTYGSVRTAAEELRGQGKAVSHVHLRWLNPLPKNLSEVLRRFPKVLVPEVNQGQLAFYLRGRYPGWTPSRTIASTASRSGSPSSSKRPTQIRLARLLPKSRP